MTQDIVARLREKVFSGLHTIGGGTIDAEGNATSWGGERIMIYRNPDGPAAAAEIEKLRAELDRLQPRLAEDRVEALENIRMAAAARNHPALCIIYDLAAEALKTPTAGSAGETGDGK